MADTKFIANHVAFGWTVSNIVLPAGGQIRFFISKGTTRETLPNRTLMTRGVMSATNGKGVQIPNRVGGMFSLELPPPASGFSTLEAVTESEWWCIEKRMNGGKLPNVGVFRAKANTVHSLPKNTKMLICSGRGVFGDLGVGTGAVLDVTAATDLTVLQDILAMTFDSRND